MKSNQKNNFKVLTYTKFISKYKDLIVQNTQQNFTEEEQTILNDILLKYSFSNVPVFISKQKINSFCYTSEKLKMTISFDAEEDCFFVNCLNMTFEIANVYVLQEFITDYINIY